MEQQNQFERAWQAPPRYIDETISNATATIDALDDDGAEGELWQLNMFLEREGIIGATARISSQAAIVSEECVESSDIVLRPVLERELFPKSTIEGTFMGCSTFLSHNDEHREIACVISYQEDSRNFVATVPYRGSRLALEEMNGTEEEDDDLIVEQAFSLLEKVKEPHYRAVIILLKQEFEADDEDKAGRLRAIGRCAAELLEHPLHIGDEARLQALHAILMSSIDDELDYLVEGNLANEWFNEETAASVLNVDLERTAHQGSLYEITYISNFELQKDDQGHVNVIEERGLQPAICFSLDDGTVVTYPMRHITNISEEYLPLNCEQFNEKVRRGE